MNHLFFSKFKSIRTTMLFSFSILIIGALLIFLIISLNYTQDTVVKNSTDYTMQLVNQVNNDIDSYIHYMKNISTVITANSDVKTYLYNYSTPPKLSDIMAGIRAKEQFHTITGAHTDICNIGVVIVKTGKYLFQYDNLELNDKIEIDKLDWYQKTVAANGATVLSSSHIQTLIKDEDKRVVTISNMLSNPYTKKKDSLLFIDLNYNTIRDLCKKINLGTHGYVFIFDENGQIIYHPKQQFLDSKPKEEKIKEIEEQLKDTNHFITKEGNNSRLFTFSRSENTGWTVVGVSYTKELMANKQRTQIIYVAVAIFLFFVATVTSILLSKEITRPIKELQISMQEVEKGNFKTVAVAVTESNEIASLSNSFNLMIMEIQKLMEQIVEEQKQKRQSELKALQSQINPHFLYNTLDSIIWMSELGKNQEVVLMTSAFAKLLRQSISNEDEFVTVFREIEYTKLYLTIQKMRYQDKLEFEFSVAEQIVSFPMIKLVLQPLVENALYHGIKYKEGIGMISIAGYIEGEMFVLQVKDNGSGMTAEQLAGIFHEKSATGKTSGVGIKNVQDRLQLHYGKEYGLTFESSKDVGTTASIHLPLPKGDV
ncbi:sensor histidine kinase [Lachnospiraceae bacterium ZAX-1]